MNCTQPQTRAEILRFPIGSAKARDELNLCEFPLAVLSDRTPPDTLELTFNDTVWDEAEKKRVERTLHVSAPPKYGLPTAKDEEVLLALIHLTDQLNQFQHPTVYFTRYELIKLLGWNQGGKSYQRIRESLARWKSVTLDYRNAWRDHRNKSWVSEIFSIIDNVTIYEADEREGSIPSVSGQMHLPFSSFTWNRVFFDSMQAKYFKRLDFSFYQRLRTPTAKRLFRFLDKRFGSGRREWEFDLHEFAFEHIGLSRNYDTGKIKEKLQPAIQELESEGFLAEMTREQRYRKRGKQWQVRFTQASKRRIESATQVNALVEELTKRGVSPNAASDLVRQCREAVIRSQVDVFDWLMEKHRDSLSNPAGFLAESIRSEFAPPAGYRTKDKRRQAELRHKERRKAEEASRQAEKERSDVIARERAHVAEVRSRLSQDELQALEQEAIAQANDAQQAALRNPMFRNIQLHLMTHDLILKRYPLANMLSGPTLSTLFD
jgi:hypothetical protein